MKVVFFHRKRVEGNFSIENVFELLRNNLPSDIQGVVKEMSHVSKGIVNRLLSCLEAAFSQGDVNHITGDIHFVAIFLRKKRTLLTIHDVGFMNHPHLLSRILLKWFWIRLPVMRCAAITTVSMASKLEILKYVNVHPDQIQVIYNPIVNLFCASPKPFNKRVPEILQIGTKPNKNIPRLAKALQGISCKLCIVGALDPATLQLLKECAIDFTVFVNLTIDQLIERYSSADIVSFVSTLEGFGLPIVEANAVGRVVVTSNLSSMTEIAGQAAHLINPFDVISIREGIIKVIEEDAYREKLIQNGFKNVLRFDQHVIARQYVQIYRGLLGAKQSN